jgi:hypothetical protein
VPAPAPWVRQRDGFVGQAVLTWRILSDRAFWREIVWGTIDPLSGAVLAFVPFALIAYGLFGTFVQPFVWLG